MTTNKFSQSKLDIRIGKQIYDYRNENHISQEQFSKQLGITKNILDKYEKGAAHIPAALLFEIAKIMKVKIEDFFPKFHTELNGCIAHSWFEPL